jgi:hypothetical protein
MAKDYRVNVPPRKPKQNINIHVKETSRIWITKNDKLNVEV